MIFPLELAQVQDYEEETDLKYIYPMEISSLNEMVATVCDQMEYDGSMMYDRYPDKVTVERLASSICCHQCQDQDMGNMGRDRWMKPLVEVMLCNEMNCRREKRCRHKRQMKL